MFSIQQLNQDFDLASSFTGDLPDSGATIGMVEEFRLRLKAAQYSLDRLKLDYPGKLELLNTGAMQEFMLCRMSLNRCDAIRDLLMSPGDRPLAQNGGLIRYWGCAENRALVRWCFSKISQLQALATRRPGYYHAPPLGQTLAVCLAGSRILIWFRERGKALFKRWQS